VSESLNVKNTNACWFKQGAQFCELPPKKTAQSRCIFLADTTLHTHNQLYDTNLYKYTTICIHFKEYKKVILNKCEQFTLVDM